MKLKALILSLLIPMSLALQPASAASVAIQQMAEILLNMENTPTPAQHEVLRQIADGTNVTANEQALAKAMLNMNGSVKAEDKDLVWGVLRDVGAFEGEKELAKVLNQFDTNANPGLRKRLQKLLPPQPKPEPAAEAPPEQSSEQASGEATDTAAQ